MRIVFFVNTPAQAHEFKNAIKVLRDKGHSILVLARDHSCTLELLDEYGIEYRLYGRTGRSKYGKFLERPFQLLKAYAIARGFAPDLVIGLGDDVASTSLWLRKPGIMFDDTEPSQVRIFLKRPFNITVLTPACFTRELGRRQVRYGGYKELAYLHPNHFQPDPAIYDLLGIGQGEKYAVLRFNPFDASHDFGARGFSTESKLRLVKELQEHAHVFISSEGNLPQALREYELRIPPYRIHDALYYAQLLVTDAITMITEAAVLGTPAIHCSTWVRGNRFGNLVELERKYGLLYTYDVTDQDSATEKALELIQRPDIKPEWHEKRQRLLSDKIDVTDFMISFIENYPKVLENWGNIEEKGRAQARGED